MRILRYTGADGATRLDKFVLAEVPGLPASLLNKFWRQNKVKLGGKKAPLATRLENGDEVRLYLPPGFDAQSPAPPALEILFEDDDLLGLYKPAGLLSLEESGQGRDSLLARARAALAAKGEDADALQLCHRLDTGTSGVLLAAKNAAALDFVTGLIAEGRLQKTYWGLSFGHPAPAAGVLCGWLQKDAQSGTVRALAHQTPGAKPAETAYETLKTCGPLALLRISPRTGRTHQIRAQLAGAGTPLLGDSKYGDVAANRRYRCRYQCLCAGAVAFPAIEAGPFAKYSRLVVSCQKPWFYTQALEGTIAPHTPGDGGGKPAPAGPKKRPSKPENPPKPKPQPRKKR